MLGNQRCSNWRGAKAAIALKQPLMKFVRAAKMTERWAMVPMGTLVWASLFLPEGIEMHGPQGELLRKVSNEINDWKWKYSQCQQLTECTLRGH